MPTRIPRSHPRYQSLVTRERMAAALRRGLIHDTGMIAHGRGEAFDYLLGETTTAPARKAIAAAAAALVLARRPLISANGNSVALAAGSLVDLGKSVPSPLEVNLFHRTPARVRKLELELRRAGATQLVSGPPDARIPGLDSDRARCHRQGLFSADTVLVPLEDGDRAQALVRMGKTVVAVDLNPLSRTAQAATITIVDELTRTLPLLAREVRRWRRRGAPPAALQRMLDGFDNRRNLHAALDLIRKRLARA